MGVLDAFMSTWSNARATFGAGALPDGAAFDGGATLDRLAEQVRTAAPESYTADEVQRIIDRQRANAWTYDRDVRFILPATWEVTEEGFCVTP